MLVGRYVHYPHTIRFWSVAGLCIGGISYLIPALGSFFWVPLFMPFHELGHAVAGWLFGKPSVPAPFITLALGEVSLLLQIIVTGVLMSGIWFAHRAGSSLATGALLLLFAAQLFLSFAASSATQNQVELLAGLAGECLFAPIFAWLALVNLGSIWRRYRVGVAACAAITLGNKFLLWGAVVLGMAEMPHGALLLGEEYGDTNRLMQEFNWRQDQLQWFFAGNACFSLWMLFAVLILSSLDPERACRSTQ